LRGDVTTVDWRADPLDLLASAVAGLNGEQRDGQVALTEAVAAAIGAGHHLIAEAPTGSGKSLAYLAPAVASGLKVVVATSTIALQSQLVSKDLGAAGARQLAVSFACSRAAPNYLCAPSCARPPGALFEQPVGIAFPEQLHACAFAEESTTGDKTEIEDDIAKNTWAAVGVARAPSARARPTAPTGASASPSTPATSRRVRRSSS
jgi:ATP-dependent DNA helicase DinG